MDYLKGDAPNQQVRATASVSMQGQIWEEGGGGGEGGGRGEGTGFFFFPVFLKTFL